MKVILSNLMLCVSLVYFYFLYQCATAIAIKNLNLQLDHSIGIRQNIFLSLLSFLAVLSLSQKIYISEPWSVGSVL